MPSLDLNSFFVSIFTFFEGLSLTRAHDLSLHALQWLQPLSTVLSLLFLSGIIYCFLRLQHIEEATVHHDHAHEPEGGHSASGHGKPESATTKRWDRITSHLESGRESDWRLAILEADVLLSEMVTNMGYGGESLGEKLKAVEPSDFTTLKFAWEAHGVRNKIAHEGAAFALTEREAKRVIGLYEEVFREFKYI